MYIDPMVAITEYELHVRDAEQHIARLRALEERRAHESAQPARAVVRRTGVLRRLLPRHGA
ncbi:hypothetical protein [Microbacterium sp. JZ31]|uniref:hypothetical protein n=1 Tax=Microbacterium sp. JZ31 TaxID=1906274 RepID=UPI001934B5DE|nr:hypothetical protein [Microbacterium sp. JZ31]